MHQVMMLRAEQVQIVTVGAAAVVPGLAMMRVAPRRGPIAPREDASAVPGDEKSPQ
jgi:hypothetical protein